MSLEHDWPLFGLNVTTPRLTLRHPTDADLERLNAIVGKGIHDPAWMPFEIPWTDEPETMRPRHSLQHWWRTRAEWDATKWTLTMMVSEGSTVVGVQDLMATNFAVTREVASGSWLGRAYQGHGIGKEMRAAILHLAFAGLGAERATSGAFEDNAASIGVSRALGYVENGDEIKTPRGERRRSIRFLLTRAQWETRRRNDIQIHGLESCLSMFDLSEAD
ncbi:MAG TPA: GNAT family protein [Candidatus Dormibacteraeota bacterium]